MDESTIKQPEGEIKEPETNEESGIEKYPEDTRDYIKSLREEAKTNRLKAKELNDALEAARKDSEELKALKQKELEAQGDYKKLLEEKEKELESLKAIKPDYDEMQTTFNKMLEDELQGIGETAKQLILNSSDPIARKLATARELKKELNLAPKKSPAAERVGGESVTQDEEAIIAEYRKERNSLKRYQMIEDIRKKLPHLLPKLK